MEMLKNKKISIGGSLIAALCIIIYLFALIQGAVRIYLSIDQRKVNVEREFSQIADLALSAGSQSFMDERFVQTMNNALTSSKSIEALIITGADNGYAFEKVSGHAVTWVNNSPRFINKISFSNQELSRALPITNIRNANIKAVASAFDFNEFTKILKDTLLVISIGFVIAFVTMLMQHLLLKPAKEQIIYANPPETKKKEEEQEDIFTIDDDLQTNIDSKPKGLYSSRSNIGWEEYTVNRLDSELHKCSSTEKDLALIVTEFADENLFMQAVQESVSYFSSRDLIYEYGNKGMSIIIPDIGLENAITKIEGFHQYITEKLFLDNDSGIKTGISSRSGRLLNAERLILEAGEALKKAKNDIATSLIAFKCDPEKYREYVRSHG